jgi:hypothetical protein
MPEGPIGGLKAGKAAAGGAKTAARLAKARFRRRAASRRERRKGVDH